MSFEPIENYGVIGNMRSIALVGVNGSIDFLCYPNFDSPTVFAALLDDEKGGCFHIEPQFKKRRVRQLYLPDTNILLTRFFAEEGVAELTDSCLLGRTGNNRMRLSELWPLSGVRSISRCDASHDLTMGFVATL